MGSDLAGLVDAWIADRRVRSRRGLSPNSERAYRTDLATFARRLADHHQRPAPAVVDEDLDTRHRQQLARIDIGDFSNANLATVFGHMVAHGAAASSRGRMLAAIRGFSRWLVIGGHHDVDPTIDFETPQAAEQLPVAFTDDQLSAIIAAAAEPDQRLHAHWAARDVTMIGVLAGCGLRSSELTDLELRNIQRLEPFRIRVTGKGDKDRVLPLSAEVLDAIDHYVAQRHQRELGGHDPEDAVFVRTNGAPLDNRALQHLIDNWLRAAGISPPPGEKVHAFRHTYAVGQLDHGTNIAELQALLGHKNLATTSIYLRVAAEGLHHTARATAINALIGRTLPNRDAAPTKKST